jgi:diaminopimelate epimerase
MRIFNSDGSEPEMCGNGIRCLARFVADIDGKPPATYKCVERRTFEFISTALCRVGVGVGKGGWK